MSTVLEETTNITTRPAAAIDIGGLMPAAKLSQLEALIESQVSALSNPAAGTFRRALQMSKAIADMRTLISKEVLSHIMPLQGSRLGFRTDKDQNGGYPAEVVKECLIEAVLNGAMPCGNEFNIIAGNAYLTREFFTRRLREWPGLTDLVIEMGVPAVGNGGALVECRATWRLNGVPDSVHCRKTADSDSRIPVRVNANAIVDATLGKAERKLRARVWAKLTGSASSGEGDVEDMERLPAAAGAAPLTLTAVMTPRGGEDQPPFDANMNDDRRPVTKPDLAKAAAAKAAELKSKTPDPVKTPEPAKTAKATEPASGKREPVSVESIMRRIDGATLAMIDGVISDIAYMEINGPLPFEECVQLAEMAAVKKQELEQA